MPDTLTGALMAAGEAARGAMMLGHCCTALSACASPPCTCAQSVASAAVAEFLAAIPVAWVRDFYGTDEAVFIGLLRERVLADRERGRDGR